MPDKTSYPTESFMVAHENKKELVEAVNWLISYDPVERAQIIGMAYEMWQEQQQVALQQMGEER